MKVLYTVILFLYLIIFGVYLSKFSLSQNFIESSPEYKEGRTKEFAIFQGEEIAKEKQYKFRRIISFTFLIVSIIVFLASIWFINIKVFEKSIILKIICVFSLVWILLLVVSNSLKIFPFPT